MTFETFKVVFAKLVDQSGYSDAEVARRLDVNRSTIGRWKSGEQSPALSKIKEIAALFNVNPMVFVDEGQVKSPFVVNETKASYDVVPVKGKSHKAPLYGSIAAGQPLEMITVEDYIEIPESLAEKHPNAFLLRVNGDSMNKIIPNGAYALIDPKEEINNGDIAAVSVDGFDATLKRFFRLQNTVALEPDSFNPDHIAKLYGSEEASTLKVIGKMIWYMSPYNVKY
ncbi:LexA family transcriptional regulator [Cohnella sp. AR92]|uniref:LexA family protein n=1 Tax=Cohnella sp. AR92 TaxID=648716 RepID=UPI001315A363|nr:XRE family transcriptional regulator [Cohnella sp. AR92]